MEESDQYELTLCDILIGYFSDTRNQVLTNYWQWMKPREKLSYVSIVTFWAQDPN